MLFKSNIPLKCFHLLELLWFSDHQNPPPSTSSATVTFPVNEIDERHRLSQPLKVLSAFIALALPLSLIAPLWISYFNTAGFKNGPDCGNPTLSSGCRKSATAAFPYVPFCLSTHRHNSVILELVFLRSIFFLEKCDCSAVFISVLYNRAAHYFSTWATLSCSCQNLFFIFKTSSEQTYLYKACVKEQGWV